MPATSTQTDLAPGDPGAGLGSSGGSDPLGSSLASWSTPTVDPTSALAGTTANLTSSGTDVSGGNLGSDISSILTGLSGVASSPLGALGLYGGLYELGSSQAADTATENNNLTNQITSIGTPLVSQGESTLNSFAGGQLTQPFQTQVTAAENTNANNAISQQQQVASLLAGSGGGQNVEGAMGSESQQIQNQQSQLNTQAVSNAFTNELSSGLQLTAEGGGFIQSGITQEINNNTQLQGQLQSLMASLASAYAKQMSSSGTSTGSLTSGLGSILNGLMGTSPSSIGSMSSLASGNNSAVSGLNTSTAGAGTSAGTGSASDDSIFDTDSAMNSSTNSYLDSMETNIDQSGYGNTLDSLLNDSASGVADTGSDVAGFSSGSGTAGTTLGDTPAENLPLSDITAGVPTTDLSDAATAASSPNISALGSVGSSLGGAASIYGAVEDPANPVNDIQAAGGAAKLANAGLSLAGDGTSDALSSVASYAGPIAAAVGLAYNDYQLLDPANTPDALLGENLPGATVGKLPSGNSILEDSGIGLGLGTQQTQGSGEVYQTSGSGNPVWIGQQDSGTLENDFDQLQAAEKGTITSESVSALDSQTTETNSLLGGATYTTNAGTGIGAQATASTVQSKMTPAQQQSEEASATNSMLDIFQQTGGEAAWGQDSSAWLSSLTSAFGDIYQGTEWGRT